MKSSLFASSAPEKITINDIVILADSLADRGQMAQRELFDIIPMSLICGLEGKSPLERFTNGFAWTDFLALKFAQVSHFNINLSNPTQVIARSGENIMRTFCEGGATAYDYSCSCTCNPVTASTRRIVSSLKTLRKQLFEDDEAAALSIDEKARTLVIEGTGANDLITVNTAPETSAAENAVIARIENVREMIDKGYRHFVLLLLADISLTPRFQRKTDSERNIANGVITYFNNRLQDEITTLQQHYPNHTFQIYDTSILFKDAFDHPVKYQLDESKKRSPFLESPDFQNNGSATGYMFWDDVHPTQDVHRIMADNFFSEMNQSFLLRAPRQSKIEIFKEHYGRKLAADRESYCGFFSRSNLDYQNPDLTEYAVLRHALIDGAKRTQKVIRRLGWINEKGRVTLEGDDSGSEQAISRVKEDMRLQ